LNLQSLARINFRNGVPPKPYSALHLVALITKDSVFSGKSWILPKGANVGDTLGFGSRLGREAEIGRLPWPA